MTRKQALELILILFPHYSHYDWSNIDIHVGEYDRKGWRHTDAIQVIQFPSPAWHKDHYQITIWKDGLQIWKNHNVEGNSNQFKAHNYLKELLSELV